MSSDEQGPPKTGEARAWVALAPAADVKMEINDPSDHYAGTVPAMARLLAAHPSIWPLFRDLYTQIMFSDDSALSRAEREMVAATAAAAQDCFY
jgi:alkylhydroperoxidase family enzyme